MESNIFTVQISVQNQKLTIQTANKQGNPEIIADSRNYLYTQFSFSEEWSGTKYALFSNKGNPQPVAVELTDDGCFVPYEVIKAPGFGVSAYCNTDDDRLITTEVKQIYVGASGYSGSAASPKPPPTGTLPVYTPEDAKVAQIRASDGKLEYTGDGETWNGVIDVGDSLYKSIEDSITTKIQNSSVIGTF